MGQAFQAAQTLAGLQAGKAGLTKISKVKRIDASRIFESETNLFDAEFRLKTGRENGDTKSLRGSTGEPGWKVPPTFLLH